MGYRRHSRFPCSYLPRQLNYIYIQLDLYTTFSNTVHKSCWPGTNPHWSNHNHFQTLCTCSGKFHHPATSRLVTFHDVITIIVHLQWKIPSSSHLKAGNFPWCNHSHCAPSSGFISSIIQLCMTFGWAYNSSQDNNSIWLSYQIQTDCFVFWLQCKAGRDSSLRFQTMIRIFRTAYK